MMRARMLILLGLILVVPGHVLAKDAPSWRTPAWLKAQTTWACDAVEKVCGVKFRTRPIVKFTTRDQIARIFEQFLRESSGGTKAERHQEAVRRASFTGGLYVPPKDTVHLVIDTFKGKRAADSMRVVLAHECAHALDHERFEFIGHFGHAEDIESTWCRTAIAEGHAEWVSERVCLAHGLKETFERIRIKQDAWIGSRERTWSGRSMPPAAHSYDPVSLQFYYRDGLRFFRNVFAAEGRTGVTRALQSPPTRAEHIDHPARWLAGATPAPDEDTARVRDTFQDFAEGGSRMSGPIVASFLQRVGLTLPKSMRAGFGRGFVRGHRFDAFWQGRNPNVIRRQWWAFVLAFETEEDAASYAATRRDMLFVDLATKTAQIRRRRNVVSETLTVSLPGLDRRTQDAFLTYALAPPETHKSIPAPKVRHSLFVAARDVRIRIKASGIDASSTIQAHWRCKASTRSFQLSGTDGVVRLEDQDGELTITCATDGEGNPVAVGPHAIIVAKGANERDVELPAGRVITGRVAWADGAPVAGAHVRVKQAVQSWSGGLGDRPIEHIHGSVVADADGVFRVPTLGPFAYEVSATAPQVKAWSAPTTVSMETSESAGPITLTPRHVAAARLRVVGPDNGPLNFVLVKATRSGSRTDTGTDGGVCTLKNLDMHQTYRLELRPNASTMPDVAVRVIESWRPQDQTIRLKAGWVLEGTLVDSSGEPVAGAVTLADGVTVRTRQTDPRGRFRFANVPRTTVRITAGRAYERHLLDDLTRWTSLVVDVKGTEVRLQR